MPERVHTCANVRSRDTPPPSESRRSPRREGRSGFWKQSCRRLYARLFGIVNVHAMFKPNRKGIKLRQSLVHVVTQARHAERCAVAVPELRARLRMRVAPRLPHSRRYIRKSTRRRPHRFAAASPWLWAVRSMGETRHPPRTSPDSPARSRYPNARPREREGVPAPTGPQKR